MISRALSLFVILPSFAFALLFVASDGFAPPKPHGCGTAAMAGLMLWTMGALASVLTPLVLAFVRSIRGKAAGDLWRIAGLAMGGHAALVGLLWLRVGHPGV